MPNSTRTRPDRCPGVLRPWAADDGALTRIRVPGGQLPTAALLRLAEIADSHGDGRVHVTARANLQLRSLPLRGDAIPDEIVAAIEETGLLPSRSHDLVRNVLASPQTGLAGGLADVRAVVDRLDRRLLADPRFGDLPGRFLFTLDDGRGDLHDRHLDLGLVALDDTSCTLRIGSATGPVTALDHAADALADLALAFLDRRGTGPTAAWHVAELAEPLVPPVTTPPVTTDPGPVAHCAPLPYGDVPGGHHADARDGLTRDRIADWTATTDRVVLTPWHGVLIPEHTA